ncbi:MAG: T9SS C-terminal target domain-containing protein [Prevotella sp.]|nr:T9SS C-terminal target domain-containing protein [Prevotella sp.]MBQ8712018.1 T9SS C-terminal target domain-containing protein [Prevotella sp.]
MKKIFTLTMFALAAMSATAQEYNLFNAADVDADGWLWLNTQEKIDKYVGACDEDNYTVDPNGKLIQMVYANIMPDYPETTADPDVLGTDKAGWVEGQEADGYVADEAIKGAITIAGASAMMSTNGGCLILNLPSCSTISLYLSSEARILGRTLMLTPGFDLSVDDSTGDNPMTGHTKGIYSKASVLGSLHGAGQWQWEGIETLNNGYNTGVTFKSDGPVYFALQNCNRYPIYVHAIKVTTPKQETVGISEVAAGNAAAAPVYNLAGQRIAAPQKGINIIGGKKYCY